MADVFDIVDADPDVIRVREKLETIVAATVPSGIKQVELLQVLNTEFEPALATAVMSAFATVYTSGVDSDDRTRSSNDDSAWPTQFVKREGDTRTAGR